MKIVTIVVFHYQAVWRHRNNVLVNVNDIKKLTVNGYIK